MHTITSTIKYVFDYHSCLHVFKFVDDVLDVMVSCPGFTDVITIISCRGRVTTDTRLKIVMRLGCISPYNLHHILLFCLCIRCICCNTTITGSKVRALI